MASQLLLRGLANRRLPNAATSPLSHSPRIQLQPSAFGGQQKRFAMSSVLGIQSVKERVASNPLPYWLFGCAALMGTTLTVGAAARLTRSGASLLYYKPPGFSLPKTREDWERNFRHYKEFCQHHQHKPMTLEDFERNFKWEYSHRLLGQASALAVSGPLAYFFYKNTLPPATQGPVLLLLFLGVTQMYVGRHMVRSNLLEGGHKLEVKDPERESTATFALPAHTALTLANMSLALWTAFHLVSPTSHAVKLRESVSSSTLTELGVFRKYVKGTTGLLLGTIVAGTLVAEIDAGRVFNTFPKMGDHWIPKGLFDQSPTQRNFYDNQALVQLDHRLLAVATLGAYTWLYMRARKPHMWEILPPETKTALNWTMLAVGGQVVGGVTMLVNAVPTTLALVHQGGAALAFSTSLWTLYTLRFARPMGITGVAKAIAPKSSLF